MIGRLEERTVKLSKQISSIKNHYILCGVGRTGRHIAEYFYDTKIPFVVIERNIKSIYLLKNCISGNMLCIEGDASEDDVLESAGIDHAKGLITTLHNDKENAFVILTARSLNQNLQIITRVTDGHENTEKLRKAGADIIISPDNVGGMRMASEMIRPEVVQFIDHMIYTTNTEERLRFIEIYLDEIIIDKQINENQTCIADIGYSTELLVVAIKRDGKYLYKPVGNTCLHQATDTDKGDKLVIIGTQKQIDQARRPI